MNDGAQPAIETSAPQPLIGADARGLDLSAPLDGGSEGLGREARREVIDEGAQLRRHVAARRIDRVDR